jgi:hypothetical protein
MYCIHSRGRCVEGCCAGARHVNGAATAGSSQSLFKLPRRPPRGTAALRCAALSSSNASARTRLGPGRAAAPAPTTPSPRPRRRDSSSDPYHHHPPPRPPPQLLDTHAVGVRREKMYKLDEHIACAVAGMTGEGAPGGLRCFSKIWQF